MLDISGITLLLRTLPHSEARAEERELRERAQTASDAPGLFDVASDHEGALDDATLAAARALVSPSFESVWKLASAAEHSDDAPGLHVLRVGVQARLIAQELDEPPERADLLLLAAPLHDIGKLAVPERVLSAPGGLEGDDWKVMRSHSTTGAGILEVLGADGAWVEPAQRIARSHHERWDGFGYPDCLRGEEIPLEARIVGVADVFDALLAQRCYRDAFDAEEALDYLEHGSGSHFDPRVVAAFVARLDEHLAVQNALATAPQPATA